VNSRVHFSSRVPDARARRCPRGRGIAVNIGARSRTSRAPRAAAARFGREGEGDDATVGAASCEDVADERQLAEQWGLVA